MQCANFRNVFSFLIPVSYGKDGNESAYSNMYYTAERQNWAYARVCKEQEFSDLTLDASSILNILKAWNR